MSALKTQVKPCNFVDQDQIWKLHVNIEIESAKSWPNKWGFLTETYNQAMQDSKKAKESIVKLELPQHLKTRPPTPPEKYIKSNRKTLFTKTKPCAVLITFQSEEDIADVSPSPPVPRTSQAVIGWRSTVPDLQLEQFGRVHYGKKSFLKELGWTLDACN